MSVVTDGAAGFEPGGHYRNYVIEDLLGRGGMSAVYRARHELTGRLAAIKVMVTRGSRAQADPQALERFRREAEFLCRLEHPNLPAIYDMDVLPDGTGIIVMEHLEGRDLGDLLRERRRLTPVEVFGIAIEIVKPLAFAHNHGIVHRDLKPGNVFICNGSPPPSKGRVRVLDFGIAKHKYSKGITREHMIVGTVSYMSPEQLMGQTDRIDGCSDQYSLGAMLYQALAGHALFIKPGDEVPNPTLLCYWHISRDVPDLREELPGLHDDAWRIVARLLEKKPGARYPRTEDLFEDLVGVQRKLLAEQREQAAASDARRPDASRGRVTAPDDLDRAQKFRPVAMPPALAEPSSLFGPEEPAAPSAPTLPSLGELAAPSAPMLEALGQRAAPSAPPLPARSEPATLPAAAPLAAGEPSTPIGPAASGSMGAATAIAIANAALDLAQAPGERRPPVDPAALAPAIAHAASQPTMTQAAFAPPPVISDSHAEPTPAPADAAPAGPKAVLGRPQPARVRADESAAAWGAGWAGDLPALRKQISEFTRAYLVRRGAKNVASARELLETALVGDDPQMRLAAASELGTYGNARSLVAVRAALEQEQAPLVVLLLECTVGELQARLGDVGSVPSNGAKSDTMLSAGSVSAAGAWLRGVAATKHAQAIIPGHMLVVRTPGDKEQRWLLRAEPGDQIELGAADAPDAGWLVLLVASHADYHVRPSAEGMARIVRPDGTVSMDAQAPGGRLRVGDALELGVGLRVWLQAVPSHAARPGSEMVEPWREPQSVARPGPTSTRWLLWAGVAACFVLLALLGAWLFGG